MIKQMVLAATLALCASAADAQCVSIGVRGLGGLSFCGGGGGYGYAGGGYYGGGYYGGRDYRAPPPAFGVLRPLPPQGPIYYRPAPTDLIQQDLNARYYGQRPVVAAPPMIPLRRPPPVMQQLPDAADAPVPQEPEALPPEAAAPMPPPPPNLPPEQPDNKFKEFCATNPTAPPCQNRVRGQR